MFEIKIDETPRLAGFMEHSPNNLVKMVPYLTDNTYLYWSFALNLLYNIQGAPFSGHLP